MVASRVSETGDRIYVTWEREVTEYLCVLSEGEDGGLCMDSADEALAETYASKHDEDTWRFE